MISERTVEANVLVDLFQRIRPQYPDSFVYLPTQREEFIQGYDALVYNINYPLIFQFKRAFDRNPLKFSINYGQNEMLLNLTNYLPDSIYYVFPFFSEFDDLERITPNFLGHCCFIRVEDLGFLPGDQKTFRVKKNVLDGWWKK